MSKNSFTYTTQILVLLLVCILPVVVNYSALPLGYEIPKSIFAQAIILLICAMYIAKCLSGSKITIHKSITVTDFGHLIRPGLLIVPIVLSTLLATDHTIAILGNQYRYQGALFYLCVMALLYILNSIMSKQYSSLLLHALLWIGTSQGFIAIYQYFQLLANNPELIEAGFYINGTFGQANFFAGKMLLTIAISFSLFVREAGQIKQNHKSLLPKIMVLVAICALVITHVGLILSFSYGSWALYLIGLVIFAYPYLRTINRIATIIIYFCISWVPLIFLIYGKHSPHQHLVSLWIAITDDFRWVMWDGSIQAIKHSPIFGFGIDNQHLAFQKLGLIKGFVVDRAHNFILDILLTTGLFGLISLVICLWDSIKLLTRETFTQTDLEKRLILMGLILMILRMLIHTNSIVNIIDLVVISVIWLSTNQQSGISSKPDDK